MAKESIKRSKRKKGKEDTEKKCFLGFTGLQWTAFGVFVAIVGIILGGIALCRQDRGREKSNGKDSSFIYYKDETPPKVDTVIHIHQEEKPVDTTSLPVKVVEEEPFDSTCAIFYLKGDSIAGRDAQAIRDFLLNKKQSRLRHDPFKYYPLESGDTNWFVDNYLLMEGSGDITVKIFYNFPNTPGYAMKPYYYLKEGIFGIVYKERTDGQIIRDISEKGNGVLRDCRFDDVNHKKLESPSVQLQRSDFAIIIPPYSLTQEVWDSLYWAEIE